MQVSFFVLFLSKHILPISTDSIIGAIIPPLIHQILCQRTIVLELPPKLVLKDRLIKSFGCNFQFTKTILNAMILYVQIWKESRVPGFRQGRAKSGPKWMYKLIMHLFFLGWPIPLYGWKSHGRKNQALLFVTLQSVWILTC